MLTLRDTEWGFSQHAVGRMINGVDGVSSLNVCRMCLGFVCTEYDLIVWRVVV